MSFNHIIHSFSFVAYSIFLITHSAFLVTHLTFLNTFKVCMLKNEKALAASTSHACFKYRNTDAVSALNYFTYQL